MAAEDISMCDPVLGQRIHQRYGHVVLSRNICEALWPVFSCKNLICHIKNQPEKLKKNQPARQRMTTSCSQPRNPYCIAHRQALPLGAEGASASMADRAVRAARL
jgi:hypothetical protein